MSISTVNPPSALGSSSSSVPSSSSSRPPSAPSKLSWLRQDGGRIVNEQGKTVVLRGINLGGWLVEEMWMMPFECEPPKDSQFKPIKDHVSLWSTVESRFGAAELDKIRKAMREAWITDADFVKIKAAGFNCVRLPFLADSMDAPSGLFPILDSAIDSASKRGIYVILDMHGAPGRQSKAHHTGAENCNQLFTNPEMVKKTVTIWEKIVQRYKERPEVAGYDLLNEPMGAQSRKQLNQVHDQIYRAIRVHDARHLIFIEDGFKGIDHIPKPAKIGWKNVVFSPHIYAHGTKSESEFKQSVEKKLAQFFERQATLKVPIYVGEFNFGPYSKLDEVKKFITTLQSKNISWSHWTYKFAGPKGRTSTWGLYSRPHKLKIINPFLDSVSDILTKIQQLYTLNFDINRGLEKVFQETAI